MLPTQFASNNPPPSQPPVAVEVPGGKVNGWQWCWWPRCTFLKESDLWTPVMQLWYINAAADVAFCIWALTATVPQFEVRAAHLLFAFSLINIVLLPIRFCEKRYHGQFRHKEPTPKGLFILCYMIAQFVCDGVMAFNTTAIPGNSATQLVALAYFCYDISWFVVWFVVS
jgi:hypothetical protein